MNGIDVIAYAKWLRKECKIKQRLVYGKKLTKLGAFIVIFSLTQFCLKSLEVARKELKNERLSD